MKYFVKISMEGAFPSGVDDFGTFEIPEYLYNRIKNDLALGMCAGIVKAM